MRSTTGESSVINAKPHTQTRDGGDKLILVTQVVRGWYFMDRREESSSMVTFAISPPPPIASLDDYDVGDNRLIAERGSFLS